MQLNVLVGEAPLAVIEGTTASPAQQTAALQVLLVTRLLQSGPVRASYGKLPVDSRPTRVRPVPRLSFSLAQKIRNPRQIPPVGSSSIE
jgi:hypothetical protein